MSATESPYTEADRQRWRQLLLARGQDIAKKLEDVLAGKEVRLSDVELRQVDKVREPRDKQLRRFLDLLMDRLRKVDDPRFGFDPERGAFAAVTELDEVPWLELEP